MMEGRMKNPAVFTVESHMTSRPPPLPPRPGRRRQIGSTQVLLFLLVSVALCGMVIEAWLIYQLYHPESPSAGAAMPSSSKRMGDEPIPRLIEAPSKPAAHLTGGQDVVYKKDTGLMLWSKFADPLLYKMDYKDGCLTFQENGYYYVYSKVSFYGENFRHSIQLKTKSYLGDSITLLKARQYMSNNEKQSNSFLAGVFHFFKDDAIFVQVNNTSRIVRHDAMENVFGVFMI